MRIDIWSDIACPWCWVGKRHLEAALGTFAREHPAVPIERVWRAFELDPGTPAEHDPTTAYVEHLARKYRTTTPQAQSMIDRMTATGEPLGLPFRFDRAKRVRTFDAHRLLRWAHEHAPSRQDPLKERLFVAYMHEGKNVADHETLIEVAAAAGLEPEHARAVLGTDAFGDDVRGDQTLASELGIRGVPMFVIDERIGVAGAQPPEVLVRAMNRALQESGATAPPAAPSCGVDGC